MTVNMDDGPAVCARNHPHTESNTYRGRTRSGKECRDCRRVYWRRYDRKRRGTPLHAYRVRTEPEEITGILDMETE